ncbi:hypothetical protein OSB04_005711 [Centaurea solstitialis]|uniref:Uncharacterized protein n=1 Tax=Centaurea solstitialis TaxID=347529 RepID=A0AA38TUF4_9ASTR|nr:hypothetical protein OSB04_005711 [Centaurea solstitialis]
MSRTPYFDKNGKRKGPWSKEEDDKLRAYIERYGHWNWREIPRFAGVSRCGKSCRLRWMNYLRPNLKHGNFTKEEEDLIIELHNEIGNKWSTIAAKLPGRSDNEIKNYWNSHLRKRSKQDQNVSKNVHYDTPAESIQTNTTNNPMENPQLGGEVDELEALWASLSSDTNEYPNYMPQSSESHSISSYSSSTAELTSSMFNVSECLVSSGDSIETYNCGEYDGNFWTDPIFPDYDSTRSTTEYSYSPDLDVANGLISDDHMMVSDEFLWSSMDLYSEYHSQFMK